MADLLFQKLRESNKKKVGLTSQICMSLTEDEIEILARKQMSLKWKRVLF